MVSKKQKCYYQNRTSEADKLMLREFVDFCENEAVKKIFINDWKGKKRVICGSEKCLEKAKSDLTFFYKEHKSGLETERKLKKLRGVGLSDSEIYQRGEELK